MDYAWRWVAAVVVWTGIGCGPQVLGPDEASTETGSGEAGEAGEAGDSTMGPDVGVADGTTAAPLSCDEFDDEAREGEALVFEIHNVGDEPLLLDSPCESHEYLELGTASAWQWPGGFCRATCEEELQFGCSYCDGCASSSYTVVRPGEHIEVPWPGVLYEEVSPPIECYERDQCAPTCSRVRLPTTEEITVNVAAISHADCIAAEPDPSVCDCVAPGRCENYGQTTVEPTLFATTTFAPGTAGPIVLEIEG